MDKALISALYFTLPPLTFFAFLAASSNDLASVWTLTFLPLPLCCIALDVCFLISLESTLTLVLAFDFLAALFISLVIFLVSTLALVLTDLLLLLFLVEASTCLLPLAILEVSLATFLVLVACIPVFLFILSLRPKRAFSLAERLL